MFPLTKEAFEAFSECVHAFRSQANRAVVKYMQCGLPETDPMIAKSLAYYRNAIRYCDYMLWVANPDKPKRKKREASGTTDAKAND